MKLFTQNRIIMLELDIVVEKAKIPFLAIEFDGLYWHSEIANGNKNS